MHDKIFFINIIIICSIIIVYNFILDLELKSLPFCKFSLSVLKFEYDYVTMFFKPFFNFSPLFPGSHVLFLINVIHFCFSLAFREIYSYSFSVLHKPLFTDSGLIDPLCSYWCWGLGEDRRWGRGGGSWGFPGTSLWLTWPTRSYPPSML